MEHKAVKNLKLLNTLAFLSGFSAFEGVIAVYFSTITGSFAIGMTFLAFMSLSSSFFEIPTGILSDRIGRKKTLVIYYFTSALATLIYFFANSALLLFIGVVITGFSMAMKSGAISAYVYENLEVLGRGMEFKRQEGHRQAIGRYALVASGVLGTLIIYFYDIKTAVFITFLTAVCALILSFRLTDIYVSDPKSSNVYTNLSKAWQKFKTDNILRDISIGRMIGYGGGNVEYRFRALYFSVIMPDWLVNLLGMFNNLISGLSMKYAHKIVECFGIKKSLVHLEILDKMAAGVFVIINQIWSAFAMNTTGSVAFGIRQIAGEDLLQSRYTKEQRATMGSIVGLGGSLIYGILGIAIGILADSIGVINTMLVLQPILLSSALFSYFGIKKISTQEQQKVAV